MNRFSWLGGVLVLALLGSLARADLHCEQPGVQIGEVHSGTTLSHRFTLQNNGTATIEILDMKTSCGCLSPRISQRVFAPGARGVIELDINTLTQPAGPQSWRVTVRYREGQEEKETAVQLLATIVTEVTITPPTVILYTTGTLAHDLTLTDRRKTPMTVTAVQPSSQYLRTQLGDWTRNDAGESVRTIALEVLPEMPDGRHEEVIQIFSSDPEYRELKIPVTIVKRPKHIVSASPDELAVSTAAGEAVPTRTVLLRAADDQDVVIDRVDCDSPAVACQTAAGPGHRATLKIQIDRAKVNGETLQCTVRVMLKQPAGQTVSLPVSWTQK